LPDEIARIEYFYLTKVRREIKNKFYISAAIKRQNRDNPGHEDVLIMEKRTA